MNKVYQNFTELVGNTPILKLNRYQEVKDLKANIYAKLEYFNPTGSIKDRAAIQMVKDAMAEGKVDLQTTLIEPTSGNTGIGLAAMASSLGMKILITMPESMSVERRKLLHGYGAELILTPASEGMTGAINKANELAKEIQNSFIPSQFDNPSNALAHYQTTGPEIYAQMEGKIDVVVAGIGTGGTITGVGKYLLEKLPNIEVVGIEPEDSPVLTKGKAGPHKIQGIGAGFVPSILDTNIYTQVLTVSSDNAFKAAKELVHLEGVSVGISSGAILAAATTLASQEEYKNKNIIVILPDGGDRYLSTPLFDAE